MRGFIEPGLGGILALMVAASPAVASSSRVFNANIPAQSVRGALLDLAIQARVSLGGDIAACQGGAPRLSGVTGLEAALTRLLANSGCTYLVRPDGAVIIRRAYRPAPQAAHQAVPRPSAASGDPQGEALWLSDVIVTAGRNPETPQTVAASLTSFSGERILEAGASGVADLSALVAGMTVTNLGSGRNKIFLRGMSDGAFTGQTQSTVGIYLNRIPLTYSAPDPDLKLIDINRVEVLRGPQGVLYGTGPIGGVLRIVPEAADPTGELLALSASYSDTQGGGDSSDVSFVANIPLFEDRGAIRAVAYKETLGGYIDDDNLNLRRVNTGARYGERVSVTAQLAPEWKVSAGAVRQRIDTEDTHYVYRTAAGRRRANLVREPHLNAFNMHFGRLQGSGAWGRLEATAARVDHDFASRYDASPALRQFGSDARVGAFDDARTVDLMLGDISYASPGDRRLRWVAGMFWSEATTRTDVDLSALRPVRVPVYEERRRDRQAEFAVFAHATFDLTDRMSLVAGGRYYGLDYETNSRVAQGADARPFDGEGRTSGFSPKLALDWRIDDAWRAYGQVSQGHRAGGFNTAGPIGQAASGAAVVPTRHYEGDSLWNYEVGAKGVLQEGRLQIRLAAFHADWRNLQSDQFLPSGLSYAVNVGDGANTGVEVEANWRPVESLEIRTNALLANPRITQPGDLFNSKGDAGLPGVPAVSANVNFAWRRHLSGPFDLIADGTVAYVGPSRLTFDAERSHQMGDYVTTRGSMAVASARWTATAFISNPFNTEANTFAFGDPFRLPEALTTTPLRPRTIGLSVTWTSLGA